MENNGEEEIEKEVWERIITIEIEEFVHNLILDFKGIYGKTRGDVINYIVKDFFSKNVETFQTLKAYKTKTKNRDIPYIQKRVEEILGITESIKLSFLKELLNIDQDYFNQHIIEWIKKYDFKLDNDKIIKQESE
jgi:hypothetical protein